MSFSQFTEEDYNVIQADWAVLEESARKRCASAEELEVVRRAFEFANNAHRNVRTVYDSPHCGCTDSS